MPPFLLIGGALCASLWLLLLVQSRPMTVATAAFLVAFFAQSTFGLENDLVSRVPILLLLLLAVLFAMGDRLHGQRRPGRLASLQGMAIGIVMLVGASLYTTIDIFLTVQATLAAVGIFFVGITLGRYVSVTALLDRLAIAGSLVVVGSVAAIGLTEDAWLGSRLNGIFRNPNALGAAVLLTLVAMPRRFLLWSIPVLGAVLVATGSRASALGCLVVLVMRIEWRPTTRLGAIVSFPILAALFLLFGASTFNEQVEVTTPESGLTIEVPTGEDGSTAAPGAEDETTTILRTRDNRTSQWQQGWTDFRDNLPLGSGFGTASFEYSNSPLLLLVETGMLAVPVLFIGASLAVRASRHRDKRVRALAAGLVVHSMFEAWMFAFGGFQAVIYWMVLTAALAERLSQTESDEPTVMPVLVEDLDLSNARQPYFTAKQRRHVVRR